MATKLLLLTTASVLVAQQPSFINNPQFSAFVPEERASPLVQGRRTNDLLSMNNSSSSRSNTTTVDVISSGDDVGQGHDGRARHFDKWKQNLVCLESWVNSTQRRYHSELLVACSTDWAYVHVLKAGGTTIRTQCNDTNEGKHVDYYKTHKLFTFVRDPISHFISGFMECAARKLPKDMQFKATNESLAKWLTYDGPGRKEVRHWCFQHSIPQVEYLLYNMEDSISEPLRFLDRFHYIGDKEDMKSFFIEQSLPWDDERIRRRHDAPIKATLAAGLRPEALNDAILMAICNFVKIDYCVWDYEPPSVCKSLVNDFCSQGSFTQCAGGASSQEIPTQSRNR